MIADDYAAIRARVAELGGGKWCPITHLRLALCVTLASGCPTHCPHRDAALAAGRREIIGGHNGCSV